MTRKALKLFPQAFQLNQKNIKLPRTIQSDKLRAKCLHPSNNLVQPNQRPTPRNRIIRTLVFSHHLTATIIHRCSLKKSIIHSKVVTGITRRSLISETTMDRPLHSTQSVVHNLRMLSIGH